MKVLKKIKEKIMAMSNGGSTFGWGDAQQAVDLQNAKMQSRFAMQQANMQNAMAQHQMQLAQQQAAMNNAYRQGIQPTPQISPLSSFNLDANRLYTFDELNDEGSVYNMPLQTAVDLAINMFGSGWFRDESTAKTLEENTDFLIKVLAKLHKAGRLKCETCRDFNTDTLKTAWKILDTDHAD